MSYELELWNYTDYWYWLLTTEKELTCVLL